MNPVNLYSSNDTNIRFILEFFITKCLMVLLRFKNHLHIYRQKLQ